MKNALTGFFLLTCLVLALPVAADDCDTPTDVWFVVGGTPLNTWWEHLCGSIYQGCIETIVISNEGAYVCAAELTHLDSGNSWYDTAVWSQEIYFNYPADGDYQLRPWAIAGETVFEFLFEVDCDSVAAEGTTWDALKVLYR